MNRFTEKHDGKNVIPLRNAICGLDTPHWKIHKENDLERFLEGDAADKLAWYEEADVGGRLLIAPYKIGDEVFIIAPSRNKSEENDIYLEGVVDVGARGFWTNPLPYVAPDEKDSFFAWDEIGKRVFLDKEDAIRKLNT